jgi:quercetin dioxygenase-like cupin family protein
MIERGRTSPSVSTLFKLAEALDVPITAFFRVESDRNDIVFRKKTDRKRIVIPNGIWEGLGGESFTGRVEAFTITLEPDASSGPFGILHTGAEFVLCLEGEVRYEVEDRAFILEPGDSLIFTAQRRHRWENLTRSRSKLVVVISGFETDEQPSEFHLVSGTQRNPLPNDGK